MQDFRHALRGLRKSPGFATIVALTLALAIGANTAIFSVVRGVLLKPLPNRDGDRLVYLRQSTDQFPNIYFSVPEIRDFRTGARAFAQIAEYSPTSVIMRTDRDAMRLSVGLVTGNYFEVMGLSPILGRVTRPSDDGPGVAPVMILTHDFWQRRFRGDSSIVGKIVTVDGKSAQVIGVLQAAPFFPQRMDVLMNMVISPHHIGAAMQQDRRHRMTEVVARMAPGVTFEQAKAELATVYARLEDQYPDAYGRAYHYRTEMIPFKKALGQDAQVTLWLLMAAAAFVLIIAVANVANLTMMRRVRREQELLVRSALGAGVGRLRRLVLTENLILGSAGAAFGTVIAIAGLPLLVSLANRYSARANEIHLDTPVLGFTLAIALAVALLLSFVTAMPSARELAGLSSGGGRRATGGRRRQRVQRTLVVVQVAVSVVLLTGAGLLTRTMVRLSEVDTGLSTEQVLSLDVNILTPSEMRAAPGSRERTEALFATIREQIAGVPGVEAVSTGSPPLTPTIQHGDLQIEGRPLAPGEPAPTAVERAASPGYFSSIGLPVLRGRAFTSADADYGYLVIVNQAFADQMFPGVDPIGKRFAEPNHTVQNDARYVWLTIVGVVGNTRYDGLDSDMSPAYYHPMLDEKSVGGAVVIRARRDVEALEQPVVRIIKTLAPSAAIENVKTIKQIKDEGVAPRRLNAALLSSFGLLAVLIAAVGIAGVLAFAVSARTNEIGIRMSLGADAARIQRMILTEGGTLVVLGLVGGGALAFAAANVIRGLLYGIAPHDPMTFAGVSALMAAIGIGACWIPAARAARIDPAITMRAEQ